VIEAVSTPLQMKLETMTTLIGYIGMTVAILTAVSLIVNIFLIHHGKSVGKFLIEALLISVTIIVVAVPEGLPLAVTISLGMIITNLLFYFILSNLIIIHHIHHSILCSKNV